MYDAENKLRDLLRDITPDTGGVPFDPIARRAARRRTGLAVGVSALTAAGVVSAVALLPEPDDDQVAVLPKTSTAATSSGTGGATRAADCVTGPEAGNVIVDYIDFVNHGGRSYRATEQKIEPRPMPTGVPFPGRRIGTVTCTLSETQPDKRRPQRDGDAAFLKVGTPLFAVFDEPTTFRIAAQTPTGTWLYEVDHSPSARTGGDLLPLIGKVKRIDVFDYETGRRVVGRIVDPAAIAKVVGGIAAAPLTGTAPTVDRPLFVRFVTDDGLATRKWAWREDTSSLETIRLPEDANAILRSAARTS